MAKNDIVHLAGVIHGDEVKKKPKKKRLPPFEKRTYLGYPEGSGGNSVLIKSWYVLGARLTIRQMTSSWRPRGKGHYMGYVRFGKHPLKKYRGYGGLLDYVLVHGGLTYSDKHDDGTVVYGFDCNHAGDDEREFTVEWLTAECERMAAFIRIAAKYEKAYYGLPDEEREKRAKLLDKMREEMRKKDPRCEEELSFGVMINLLTGKL